MCDVGMSDSYNFPTIKLILELSFKKKNPENNKPQPLDHWTTTINYNINYKSQHETPNSTTKKIKNKKHQTIEHHKQRSTKNKNHSRLQSE